MYFSPIHITSVTVTLLGCSILAVIAFILIYLRPLWRVRNTVKRQENGASDVEGVTPASVVIFASDDSESLKYLLPSILGQKYSGPFEVIVVNEGQSDATVEIVERLKMIHDNLYLTYTPDGARQLSRKKLALMIGIKAARYPVVVLTTANAVIDSDEWLARMTAPFVDSDVEVVLGHSFIDWNKDKGPGALNRIFNGTADAVVWLNAALEQHPYRGTCLNLAYTRDVFFNNRGFSRSLNLKYGDDDIFIHEIATGRNTRVVLHPDSFVKSRAYNIKRLYNEQRSRYYFTGAQLPMLARRMQAFGSLLLWIILGLQIALTWIVWPNLFGLALGCFIFLGLLITSAILWRRVIVALTGKKMLLSLMWLILLRPFANTYAWINSMRYRKYNYTWK